MFTDDGDEGISLPFTIDFHDSFGNLRTLDDLVGTVAADMFREFQRIKEMGRGLIDTSPAVTQMGKLIEGTREFAREQARVERSGDSLSRQIARQNAEFGKSKGQILAAKVETQALAYEYLHLGEATARLRGEYAALVAQQQAAAVVAAQEAQALRDAAFAHQMFETRVRQGVTAMREAEAAARAKAAADADIAARAQRLVAGIDPAAAAQQRFNAEMAEARTLISAGAITLDDYAAKLRMERGALDEANAALQRGGVSAGAHRMAMMGASYQVQDFITQVSMGANPINAFAVQGAQLAGQFANIEGKAGAVARFFMGPWGLAITGAVMLAGMFTKELFQNADAMKTATLAADNFGRAQSALGQMFDLTTGKIKAQNEMIRLNIQLTAMQLRADALAAEKVAMDAQKTSGQLSWGTWFSGGTADHRAGNVHQVYDTLARSKLQGVMTGKLDPAAVAKWAEKADFSKLNITAQEYIEAVKSVVEVRANRVLAGKIEESLEKGELAPAFKMLSGPTGGGVPSAAAANIKALSDQTREYNAALKAATDYAAAQREETARIGLDAKALRERADAAAMAAAPTEELRKAIADAADAREKAYGLQGAKDFEASVIQPLRDELALYDKTGPARDYAALGLEKQAFMARQVGVDITEAERRWKQYYDAKAALIDKDAATEKEAEGIRRLNEALAGNAELWDAIARNAQNAANGMSDAFGRVGGALGGLASIYADFRAEQARATVEHAQRMADAADDEMKRQRELARNAMATSTAQIGLYGDMASAAKGFFKEKSAGWRAVAAAEKVFRAVEFAMSMKAMIQNVAETAGFVANSAARATAAGTEGIANQSKLPFPFNIAAMAATGAALIAAGVAVLGGRGGGGNMPDTNTGTGTVLGDPAPQSESIKRAIDALREVDTTTSVYAREMAASLRSIESQIGGFASLLVRNADSITASDGVMEGFKTNAIGSVLSKIPLIGGILGGLFGTKTTILGNGLFGGPQSLGSILNSGFDASYYTDIKKKKKLFGITTSNKTSTQYSAADPMLENQFTLILRQFNDAILAAAGPLGQSTDAIAARLQSFVINIGKIDLQGLTGAQIEEKLNAVFGAAADNMANAAYPGMTRFQKVGEGAFETLVRVASTVEAVTMSFDQLGRASAGLGIDVKMAVADQFDSVSAMSSAVDAYFKAFYTPAEQAAAQAAQLGKVFDSMGIAMPATLDAYRTLVDMQDVTTTAGREAYAMLLQLAPAFADVKAAMEGAKSAADILAERMDLERKMLELLGDTAALRALDLAKLDVSNRALQEQIWALQDTQAAAKAADELRKAWASVGDTIMDEVRRIRGLSDATGAASYAALLGQFNAATSAARGGDMDAAKSLPQLSQAMLAAAQDAARSRQELDRVRAMAAASLEATYGLIGGGSGDATSDAALLAAASANSPATGSANDNLAGTMGAKIDELRAENAQMRKDLTAALAKIAGDTGKVARKLDDVTGSSGGNAVSVEIAA